MIRKLALENREEWLTLQDILNKGTEEYGVLEGFAFHNKDPNMFFSCGDLKVHYIFDEDFVNDGSAVLIFNLVASRWLHHVWLANQNRYRAM